MNGVLLMVVAAAVLACGYLGYGRWLANKWGVDKEAWQFYRMSLTLCE